MHDNRSGWDGIAAAYQSRLGWPDDDVYWGVRCPPERELGVLGPVQGRSALVLGCGGAQECVALAASGAAAVTGVDFSAGQLAHARRRLAARGVAARLIEGLVEDLAALGLADAAFDLAVSVHVMTYVERADRCFAEVFRVLVPGGRFAFSVHHPVDADTVDQAPYGFTRSYFEPECDWYWHSLGGGEAAFRSWHRTVADWFALLQGAGFQVERLLEPRPTDAAVWSASGWGGGDYYRKLDTLPATLILAGRKPA